MRLPQIDAHPQRRVRFRSRLLIYFALWLLAALAFQIFLQPQGLTETHLTPIQQRISWPLYTPFMSVVGLAQAVTWPDFPKALAVFVAAVCFALHAILALACARRSWYIALAAAKHCSSPPRSSTLSFSPNSQVADERLSPNTSKQRLCPTAMTRIGFDFVPPSMAFGPVMAPGPFGSGSSADRSRIFRTIFFTPEAFARITTKVALVADEAAMVAEDDAGRSYDYGQEGSPATRPELRAADWLGERPKSEEDFYDESL